jgi:hypothetical protein
MISDNLATNNNRVCIGLKKKFVRFISPLAAKNDGFNNLNNRYFPDVLLNNNGEDEGGFNHFELRNYERGYQLKKNGNIVFDVGDRAPQYDKIIDWLDALFNTL